MDDRSRNEVSHEHSTKILRARTQLPQVPSPPKLPARTANDSRGIEAGGRRKRSCTKSPRSPSRKALEALADREAALQEKNAALKAKDTALQEKDTSLQEKEVALGAALAEIERLKTLLIDRG